MKYLTLILLFGISFGCSQENQNLKEEKPKSSKVNYGTELIESGFLKYADTLKLDSLKSDLVRSFNIYDERNYKYAHIDAEELAEFNFNSFLPDLNRILAKRGFTLNVQPSKDIETSNDIFINDEKIKLYTKEEMDNGTFWETAPRNFFKEVNKKLNKKGIEESFYLIYSGNDLCVLLLTENQNRIISGNYKNETKEIPYLP